jgi:uncharacterized protein (TIGR03067 family)
MRLFALTILTAGLFFAATAENATADDLAPEMMGSWKLIKAERNGKSLSKEEFDNDVVLTCSKAEGGGIKCVVKKDGEVVTEGTVKHAKSDEKVKGDHYDMTYTKGTHKGKDLKGTTVHGLVHLDGDKLMVCWGEKHPKDFTAAEDSNQTCRTYERIKEKK